MKKELVVKIFRTAQEMYLKFEMQVGIIKTNHFSKFERNSFKCMGSKLEKLNFGEILKAGITPK